MNNGKDEELKGAIDADGLARIWRRFTPAGLLFLTSTTADDGQFDQASISAMADTDIGALDMMSAASAINTDYSRLRCLRRERELSSFDEVFITKAIFHAIDATLVGDLNEDAATLTAISNSLASDNDAYMQSRFRYAEIGGWQPNFFNPSIKTLGKHVVLSGYQNSNYSSTPNAGDMSIGPMLPFVFEPRFPVSIGKVPEDAVGYIVIRAFAGQIVDNGAGNQIQPYPIVCELELLGMKKARN